MSFGAEMSVVWVLPKCDFEMTRGFIGDYLNTFLGHFKYAFLDILGTLYRYFEDQLNTFYRRFGDSLQTF